MPASAIALLPRALARLLRGTGPDDRAAAASEDPHAGDRHLLLWLRVAAALSLVVPLAVLAGVAVVLHAQAVSAAEARVRRLAAIAHEHALKLFETNEILIGRIDDLTHGLSRQQILAREPDLHGRLVAMTRDLPQIHSVWVLDADGKPMLSSRVLPVPDHLDFSDRPGFDDHRQRPGMMTVTPTRRGRVTGEVFFDLSRRRDLADGTFGGLVLVGLYPTYFTSFYRQLADSEPAIVLSLLHADRSLIARWPATATGKLPDQTVMARAMAQGEPMGIVRSQSVFDGQQRIGAFRRVGHYPVYVFAGTDDPGTLTPWHRDVAGLAAFILPMSALMFLACAVALRRTRRHMDAARQLQREAAERQRVEAALRQSQKLEAMGHLTGGVAHDFNNLLMVVNLNVGLLKRSITDEGGAGALQAIQRSVAAGTQLTRQLLAFSHKQPLLPRRVDLAEVMPALLDLMRRVLGSSITLEGECVSGAALVRLDMGELELAMINLAVNARDAMPQGGHMRVRIGDAAADPGHPDRPPMVEIAVSDTGTGIAESDLERVFEPFFTTKPVGKGTGLGLSQVYGFCTRSGGTARIHSRPGAGTTVTLCFPREEGPAEAPVDPVESTPDEQPLAMRILLVEDNEEIGTATLQLLESAGCDVIHAPNAAQALRILQRVGDCFDAVLSDIVMPGGMDGLQLAAEIRQRQPDLPIVLMTGYAARIEHAAQAGLVVLPKPFGADLLVETLKAQRRGTPRA